MIDGTEESGHVYFYGVARNSEWWKIIKWFDTFEEAMALKEKIDREEKEKTLA